MPIKPVRAWKKQISKTAIEDQVSSFYIEASAWKRLVAETQVEVRGVSSDYRPGDVLKSIQGQVFHR